MVLSVSIVAVVTKMLKFTEYTSKSIFLCVNNKLKYENFQILSILSAKGELSLTVVILYPSLWMILKSVGHCSKSDSDHGLETMIKPLTLWVSGSSYLKTERKK